MSRISQIIEDFLGRLGVEIDSIEEGESNLAESTRYVINSREAALLIGNRGETLRALSHLLKKTIDKALSEEEKKTNFFIDVGDYQNQRIQEIKNKAVIMAERARFFKKNVEMPPMTAYDRMIVHSSFNDFPDIETESSGGGRERFVVIKYKEI